MRSGPEDWRENDRSLADHLKIVNDTFGHTAGGALLRRVADTLRAYLRPYNLIVRYGGDELVCAAAGMTTAEATHRFTLIKQRGPRWCRHSLTQLWACRSIEDDAVDEGVRGGASVVGRAR